MRPYDAAQRVLRASGSSFASAFRILPRPERDAMTAFYAFCRQVDDEVDEAGNPESARRSIQAWRDRIERIYGGRPEDLLSSALWEAVQGFGIQRDHLELVLDGVEQDLDVTRYGRFTDLYEYCYRVASAVGLVCVSILSERSRPAELYAELTGIAVQLTNILRDVGEDAERGRIYLPLEDLGVFGVTESDLLSLRMTLPIRRLLHFEARRARDFYDLAAAALPPALAHRLFFAEALRETYRRLLDRLILEDFPVFRTRVSLAKHERIGIALKRRLHPATFLEGLR